METGDKAEETPGHLRKGDDGEVSCSEACVGESPSDRLGGATVLDRGKGQEVLLNAHPDDTLRGALQPGWRTGSPWLLDCCDEEAGREEQSLPTFDLQ